MNPLHRYQRTISATHAHAFERDSSHRSSSSGDKSIVLRRMKRSSESEDKPVNFVGKGRHRRRLHIVGKWTVFVCMPEKRLAPRQRVSWGVSFRPKSKLDQAVSPADTDSGSVSTVEDESAFRRRR